MACLMFSLLLVMLDRVFSEVECKNTGYPLHSPVSPSLPLPCVTVSHHISAELYCWCKRVFCSHVMLTGYPLHSLVYLSLLLPCVTVCHHISTGLYKLHRENNMQCFTTQSGKRITLSDVKYEYSTSRCNNKGSYNKK